MIQAKFVTGLLARLVNFTLKFTWKIATEKVSVEFTSRAGNFAIMSRLVTRRLDYHPLFGILPPGRTQESGGNRALRDPQSSQYWPIAWYFVLIVVGWCSTNTSASNSQHACGFTCLSTITIPFRIWDLFIWFEKAQASKKIHLTGYCYNVTSRKFSGMLCHKQEARISFGKIMHEQHFLATNSRTTLLHCAYYQLCCNSAATLRFAQFPYIEFSRIMLNSCLRKCRRN